MIFRNSFIVFSAMLVGGVLNFGAISIFSRLLSPAEYGTFALAMASSALAMAFLFQWVLHSLVRFLPQREAADNKTYLLNFIFILVGLSVGFLAIAALAYSLNAEIGGVFSTLPVWVWVLVPAAAIFEALFNAISHYTRLIREHMKLFALSIISRSIIYIGIGYFLVAEGYSYTGLLFAVVLSFLIPTLFLAAGEPDLRRLSKGEVKKQIIREIMNFGLPIIAVTTIQTAISSADNFLLTYFIGTEATGQFAVALDLVTKSLIFLMLIVNRTTYPLLVKKLEHEGIEAAREQYHHNTVILMGLSIPACVGLAVLSKHIAGLLLGDEFHETAGHLIPFLTIVSFTNCALQFYLTPAFHLAKKTKLMIIPVMLALTVNIAVSSVCIPQFGINGAVIGSFCAYLTCFFSSLYFVKKIFPLPFPAKDFCKILGAAGTMGLSIWWFRGEPISVLVLTEAIVTGGIVYFLACLALNVGGYRQLLRRKLV